jgi:hypothetical protein
MKKAPTEVGAFFHADTLRRIEKRPSGDTVEKQK